MLKVTIRINGDKVIMRKLKVLGDSINDQSVAMREIGRQAIEYYASTGFSDRGRPFGAGWPDYSINYKKWKEKHYAGRPMLVRKGDMQGGFFATTTRSSVIIDNHSPHYKYHQSTAARAKIPYRPMAGINGVIKDMVKDTIRTNIIKKLERA